MEDDSNYERLVGLALAASQMTQFLGNLLDVVRLESGTRLAATTVLDKWGFVTDRLIDPDGQQAVHFCDQLSVQDQLGARSVNSMMSASSISSETKARGDLLAATSSSAPISTEVHEEPHLDIIPALAIHAHLPRCPKVGDHFISRPKGIVGGKALPRCRYFQLVARTNGEEVTTPTMDHLGEIPPNTSFGPATAIRATPVGDGTSSVISVLVPYPRTIPGMASVLEAWVSITWHDTYLASLKGRRWTL